MKTKSGLLRVVEVKYNGDKEWSPYCVCYKDEVGDYIRRYFEWGNIYPFFRFRFSGSSVWHKGYVCDYV